MPIKTKIRNVRRVKILEKEYLLNFDALYLACRRNISFFFEARSSTGTLNHFYFVYCCFKLHKYIFILFDTDLNLKQGSYRIKFIYILSIS